ncbi:MAG TPA: ERCC4 domain-containing protein [Acidimicrobiia bacterium]|nr:ERCC4 domain-containing protein [Acidimicrobiia bacterium]
MDAFLVARNPDEASQLPFLIRLPLGREVLVLKARETWPRLTRVYCHRAAEWPNDPEIIEEVPIRSCVRRGRAIDLVLARARESRSQLVFTTLKGGREAIFWQTAKTVKKARPGIRVPGRRASGLAPFTLLVDTRERYPYRFVKQQATTERSALPAGDYGVAIDGWIVASVERKTLEQLAHDLVDGSMPFQLAELAALPRAAVVVEERYSSVFKLEHVKPGWVADLIASLQARYPNVPIVFCETRPLAEEWTYRFLGAALAHAREEPTAPGAPAERW